MLLRPADDRLTRLDGTIFRPLREASYLAARLVDDETRGRAAEGVGLNKAFDEVTGAWVVDFGGLLLAGEEQQGSRPDVSALTTEPARRRPRGPGWGPPPRARLVASAREAVGFRNARRNAGDGAGWSRDQVARMQRRRQAFNAYGGEFVGPGNHETIRVIFATTLLLRDSVKNRALKRRQDLFQVTYDEVTARFRAVTARLAL